MAFHRLIITPAPDHPGQFSATLEGGGGVLVERSRQPLVDGARRLLERDFCPHGTLAMRHLGATYDSFVPQTIGELAQWTYTESEKTPLRRIRWQPFDGSVFTKEQ